MTSNRTDSEANSLGNVSGDVYYDRKEYYRLHCASCHAEGDEGIAYVEEYCCSEYHDPETGLETAPEALSNPTSPGNVSASMPSPDLGERKEK